LDAQWILQYPVLVPSEKVSQWLVFQNIFRFMLQRGQYFCSSAWTLAKRNKVDTKINIHKIDLFLIADTS